MIVATPRVPLHPVVPHPALVTSGQTVAMAGVVLSDLRRGPDLRRALAETHDALRAEVVAAGFAPGPLPAVSSHRKPRALAQLHALEAHLHVHHRAEGARDAEEAVHALVVDLDRAWEMYAGLVLVALAGSTLHEPAPVSASGLVGASS